MELAGGGGVVGQKKRAETWGQEETRVLISLREKTDSIFNTSKSNKHLWENISNSMRTNYGFDRSPTMCTDKWRNLLKDYKKHKTNNNTNNNNNNNNKMMLCFQELHHLLTLRDRDRGGGGGPTNIIINNNDNIINNNNDNSGSSDGGVVVHQLQSSPLTATTPDDTTNNNNNNGANKLNLFFHFSADDNGLGDGNIPFGSGEANSGPTADIERNLEQDDDPLALASADAANSVPPWNWRDNPEDGGERDIEYDGRVITVKWGVHVRKIGIDGTREAIKEAIKSTFRLRTNRAFWLEDEFNVTRSFDRSMPLGEYTLHVDEGITIKLCHYDETDHMVVRTVETNLYTEDHFRNFLSRSGYIGLREINGYKTFDNLGDLRPGSMYQGVRR